MSTALSVCAILITTLIVVFLTLHLDEKKRLESLLKRELQCSVECEKRGDACGVNELIKKQEELRNELASKVKCGKGARRQNGKCIASCKSDKNYVVVALVMVLVAVFVALAVRYYLRNEDRINRLIDRHTLKDFESVPVELM